jgi:ketosteroid isomerase-like protein
MSTDGLHAFSARLRAAFEAGDPCADRKQLEADNVARLQALLAAVARGDWDEFAAGLTDDAELEILGPESVPFVALRRGRDEVVAATRANFAHLGEQRPEVVSLVAQGENVTLVLRECGEVRSTGKPYETYATQMFTFRGGKVARFVETFDSAPLLDAMRPG